MSQCEIIPFEPKHAEAVLDVTVQAWTPVFSKTKNDVPRFVYEAFYPDGWEKRQTAEVQELLETEPQNFWVAILDQQVAGFLGFRLHPEDRMGEIYIIAVAPAFQRRGVGQNLMNFAEAHTKASGMEMMMVETIGDSGHEPARKAYEAFGFQPWPVARYFKPVR